MNFWVVVGGVFPERAMIGGSIPHRWTISNVVLTMAVVVGLILCTFSQYHFCPHRLVGHAGRTLRSSGCEDPQASVRSANASAAATVAIVAFIVVVPARRGSWSFSTTARKSRQPDAGRRRLDTIGSSRWLIGLG